MKFVEALIVLFIMLLICVAFTIAIPFVILGTVIVIFGIFPFTVTVKNLDGSETIRTFRSFVLIKEESKPAPKVAPYKIDPQE
jgi:hypothetical protein